MGLKWIALNSGILIFSDFPKSLKRFSGEKIFVGRGDRACDRNRSSAARPGPARPGWAGPGPPEPGAPAFAPPPPSPAQRRAAPRPSDPPRPRRSPEKGLAKGKRGRQKYSLGKGPREGLVQLQPAATAPPPARPGPPRGKVSVAGCAPPKGGHSAPRIPDPVLPTPAGTVGPDTSRRHRVFPHFPKQPFRAHRRRSGTREPLRAALRLQGLSPLAPERLEPLLALAARGSTPWHRPSEGSEPSGVPASPGAVPARHPLQSRPPGSARGSCPGHPCARAGAREAAAVSGRPEWLLAPAELGGLSSRRGVQRRCFPQRKAAFIRPGSAELLRRGAPSARSPHRAPARHRARGPGGARGAGGGCSRPCDPAALPVLGERTASARRGRRLGPRRSHWKSRGGEGHGDRGGHGPSGRGRAGPGRASWHPGAVPRGARTGLTRRHRAGPAFSKPLGVPGCSEQVHGKSGVPPIRGGRRRLGTRGPGRAGAGRSRGCPGCRLPAARSGTAPADAKWSAAFGAGAAAPGAARGEPRSFRRGRRQTWPRGATRRLLAGPPPGPPPARPPHRGGAALARGGCRQTGPLLETSMRNAGRRAGEPRCRRPLPLAGAPTAAGPQRGPRLGAAPGPGPPRPPPPGRGGGAGSGGAHVRPRGVRPAARRAAARGAGVARGRGGGARGAARGARGGAGGTDTPPSPPGRGPGAAAAARSAPPGGLRRGQRRPGAPCLQPEPFIPRPFVRPESNAVN
ncbi:collagen alpha-1(I) chain-like [Passer domesticus]|uniref:collagen alpha-1(I) chain-like n=1 Tax=Passer domesticus TaxID=48849 RepID=UPI0030FEC424